VRTKIGTWFPTGWPRRLPSPRWASSRRAQHRPAAAAGDAPAAGGGAATRPDAARPPRTPKLQPLCVCSTSAHDLAKLVSRSCMTFDRLRWIVSTNQSINQSIKRTQHIELTRCTTMKQREMHNIAEEIDGEQYR